MAAYGKSRLSDISEQEVMDHVLRFSVKLEAQEILLIHAFQYMEE